MNEPDLKKFMQLAWQQAKQSYDEGGLPIGAILTEENQVIGSGHNRRVQNGDPTAHGEMDCLRNAGRRPDYRGLTLFTTLSPCMMCAGTIVQFGIPKVVVGENESFTGNIRFLQEHGIEVVLLDDPDCKTLMQRFIRENPGLWNEDIAGRDKIPLK